jgi:HD-like signal output (HDOD) protein
MSTTAAELQTGSESQVGTEVPFQFLTSLAKELSAGRVDLPSFPEAAARLQQALADASVTSERIARVVNTDAGLTGRILTMANSTLLHRGSTPVTDLKVAVTRIGHENIRTAALAYASAQLRRAPELAHIRVELERCWEAGIRVAALAHAMAKEAGTVRADEAMLAGLLHNIGRIYIVARSPKDSAASPDEGLLREWHPGIGQALIENWKLPDEVATAVGSQLDLERSHEGDPDLADLLIVAVYIAGQIAAGTSDDAALANLPAANALGLTDSALIRIMLESQTEVEMLHAALG